MTKASRGHKEPSEGVGLLICYPWWSPSGGQLDTIRHSHPGKRIRSALPIESVSKPLIQTCVPVLWGPRKTFALQVRSARLLRDYDVSMKINAPSLIPMFSPPVQSSITKSRFTSPGLRVASSTTRPSRFLCMAQWPRVRTSPSLCE